MRIFRRWIGLAIMAAMFFGGSAAKAEDSGNFYVMGARASLGFNDKGLRSHTLGGQLLWDYGGTGFFRPQISTQIDYIEWSRALRQDETGSSFRGLRVAGVFDLARTFRDKFHWYFGVALGGDFGSGERSSAGASRLVVVTDAGGLMFNAHGGIRFFVHRILFEVSLAGEVTRHHSTSTTLTTSRDTGHNEASEWLWAVRPAFAVGYQFGSVN
jgi:hypothetical protein